MAATRVVDQRKYKEKYKQTQRVLYCWISMKTKIALKKEAAVRDIALTDLVGQILDNAAANLRASRK